MGMTHLKIKLVMFQNYTYHVFLHLVHKADTVLTTICRYST